MDKHGLSIGINIMVILIMFSGCTEMEGYFEKESTQEKIDAVDTDIDVEIITISSMGSEQTVNYLEKPVKLIVSGMNSVVTVSKETNLNEVILSGMNSIVYVSRDHSFISTITGMNSEIIYYD